MTYNKRNRTVLGLSLAAATIALGACGGGDGGSESSGASDEPTSQESSETSEGSDESTAGQPDLEGIPDVVAEVNGEDITKDDFVVLYQAQLQQASMEAQAGGEQPDEEALKEQTANNLVDTELLVQEAGERGFDATDDEVDSELDKLATQNQMKDGAELLAALEEQGTTEEQARDQLESQVVIQELVTDEAGTTEPTEKELRAIYNQAKEQAGAQEGGQKIPPYAQVKAQIVEQAKTDKLDEVARALVEDLREDADITINL